ncbi:hypothetical protein [Xenorhabdus sp. KJ12.1]|uniref:hypothetical protein n=1 Tax=Xenorhabdus sp. KJ12.1 TaxID=1851571 RepID=UPI000C041C5D|nr:hypothetical protein [Xenorhabdus sp. KJ12.1]PHM72392.1 hypothetical protein Xekj_00671 [Xenorhabdus sp. KJ12.1]
MDEINAVLAKNRGAGGVASRLTDKQILQLNNAAEALTGSLSDLDRATEAVNRLATQANDSAHRAQKSFSDAVSISIISGLLESPIMADVLKAITPTSVMSSLS